MEIRINIKKHDKECKLPYEAKIEFITFNDFQPIPNESSENEFFEDAESAKAWILEKLQTHFKIALKK